MLEVTLALLKHIQNTPECVKVISKGIKLNRQLFYVFFSMLSLNLCGILNVYFVRQLCITSIWKNLVTFEYYWAYFVANFYLVQVLFFLTGKRQSWVKLKDALVELK